MLKDFKSKGKKRLLWPSNLTSHLPVDVKNSPGGPLPSSGASSCVGMPPWEKWSELDILDLSNRELVASLRQPLQEFIILLLKTSTSFPNWKSMLDKHRHWILLHPLLHYSKKPLNIKHYCVFSPELWTSYSYHLCAMPASEQDTQNSYIAALKCTASSAVWPRAVWLFHVFLLGEAHSHGCP